MTTPIDTDARTGRPVRRAPVLVIVAALLVAVTVADRAGRSPAHAVVASQPVMPTAGPADALSSTWYCPVATANPGGPGTGTLVVTNPGISSLSGQVTLIGSQGAAVKVPIKVRGRSRTTVKENDYLHTDWVAAEVDLGGGLGTAEQVTDGSLGTSTMPCASAPSTHWYFAEGSTDKNAELALALFNPFPEDAIADLSFATDQGPSTPDAYQGIDIPAGGLTVLDLGDHVRRRVEVSTTVSVRSGRLVAGKLQLFTGGGRKGIAVALGAPAPGPIWYFPDGFFSDGVVERYHVYNPNDREAEVELDLTLDQGAAEPFTLTVPPQGRVTLVTSSEPRIPKGVAHAVTAHSTNGVDVVVERTIDAASPSTRVGYTDMLGAQASAREWALGAGGTTDTVDEWVVVLNTSRRTAHVSVTALAQGQPLAVEDLQDVAVPPGRRAAFRLGDHIKRPDLPMIIQSDNPVVVERGVFRVGGLGMSQNIGIPER